LPPLVVVVDESSVIKEFPNKEPGEKGETSPGFSRNMVLTDGYH